MSPNRTSTLSRGPLPCQDELEAPLSLGLGEPLPGDGDDRPVHLQVAEHARTTPDAVAVVSGEHQVSYRELDAWAGRIAAGLTAIGIGRGDRVGLLIEPSAASIAAVLGILRVGAAYVPVHRAHPDAQVAAVLADALVGAVVVGAADADRAIGDGAPRLVLDDRDTATGPRVAPAAVGPEDAAYLIYTSGSTGEPKGVLVGHRELALSTLARRVVYPGAPVFLLVSPLAFDSSVAGLWGTLTAGGRLVVAGADEVRDPARLLGLVRRHGVTWLLCVPSLYRVLLDTADRTGDTALSRLDTVTVAGETLPESLAQRHFAAAPAVALVNEYGPTEATVWASWHRMDRAGRVSIGRPVPGVRLYVLADDGSPAPVGGAGELHIGGPLVTRGYFGRPAETAKSFSDDPFAEGPGARLFRTGDLVKWNADGTLDFLGRRDHQVKLRGHRIELGAVEAALRALPGVRDAVVLLDEAATALTGFVVAEPGTVGTALRAELSELLPAVMVPAVVRVLPEFPVLATGKTDRAALARLDPEPVADPAAAPATGMAAKVAAAWSEVLHQDVPANDVNFFDLGGHSLTMFALQDALETHTGSRPSVVALFRHTTVAAQAELIERGGFGQDESADAMRAASARRGAAMLARQRRAERQAAR